MNCPKCKDEMELKRDFDDDGRHIDIYDCWICNKRIVNEVD